MQRVNTMHVVPDLVSDLHPSIDLRIAFRGEESSPGDIEPGLYLRPEQVTFSIILP